MSVKKTIKWNVKKHLHKASVRYANWSKRKGSVWRSFGWIIMKCFRFSRLLNTKFMICSWGTAQHSYTLIIFRMILKTTRVEQNIQEKNNTFWCMKIGQQIAITATKLKPLFMLLCVHFHTQTHRNIRTQYVECLHVLDACWNNIYIHGTANFIRFL